MSKIVNLLMSKIATPEKIASIAAGFIREYLEREKRVLRICRTEEVKEGQVYPGEEIVVKVFDEESGQQIGFERLDKFLLGLIPEAAKKTIGGLSEKLHDAMLSVLTDQYGYFLIGREGQGVSVLYIRLVLVEGTSDQFNHVLEDSRDLKNTLKAWVEAATQENPGFISEVVNSANEN